MKLFSRLNTTIARHLATIEMTGGGPVADPGQVDPVDPTSHPCWA